MSVDKVRLDPSVLDEIFGSPETPAGTSAKDKGAIDLDDIFAPAEALKDKSPTNKFVPGDHKVDDAIETLVLHMRSVARASRRGAGGDRGQGGQDKSILSLSVRPHKVARSNSSTPLDDDLDVVAAARLPVRVRADFGGVLHARSVVAIGTPSARLR